jgi:hypothetical protein
MNIDRQRFIGNRVDLSEVQNNKDDELCLEKKFLYYETLISLYKSIVNKSSHCSISEKRAKRIVQGIRDIVSNFSFTDDYQKSRLAFLLKVFRFLQEAIIISPDIKKFENFEEIKDISVRLHEISWNNNRHLYDYHLKKQAKNRK